MSNPLRYPKPPELAQLGRGHGVVESSAGTGKTFLLEHLFVELILTHGLACEEILVVTFTEKATAELVLRLRALIARLAGLSADDPRAIEAADSPEGACWIIDDRARNRLGEALLAFDRANIFTIHGFCQRVLGEHAFVQGRFFDEELIGEEAAFTDAFHEVLRAQAARGSGLDVPLELWLASGKSVEHLEKLLRACDREKNTPMRVRFDEVRLAAALAAWQPVAADDPALKARLKAAKVHHGTAKAILNRLAHVSELVATCQGDGLRFVAAMQTFRDQHRKDSALGYVLEKLPAADTSFAELSRAVRDLDEATVPLEAFLAERLSPLVRERAASRKRKAGLFDFSDMIHLVARALADAGPAGSALVEALRGRYHHALIDEFQDTDEVQWSIFRRIFVQRTLVEGGGHHALTVIGDPKQAIYGFRGADVQAYLGAREDLGTTGANRVVLDRNFRSSAGIIDATNLIFDQGADFFRRGSGITYDQPVRCGRPDLGLLPDSHADSHSDAPVVVFDLDSHGVPLRAPRARTTVQAAIVDELRVLLDARSPLRLHSQGGDRALKARDIFILTFTNAESRAIGRALGAAAIPHAFYKLGNLFESPEATEVLTVLRAIAEPEDRNLRAQALLTGFFDLDVTGAAACLDLGLGARPIQQLLRFARLAQDGDIPTLFAALIDDSGIVRREVFAHASERTLTNITHVLEILQAEWAYSHAALPALADLLDGFIQGTRKPPSQEGDLQRLETDKDAVQILTVHKAKGLEADVVFIYGGTGEATRKEPVRVLHEDGKRVLHAGPLDDAGKRLVELETRDERSRLLYVALTRARYRLYLPHYPPEFTTLKGPYAQANQRLDTILGQRNELGHAHFSVRPCPADAIPASASDTARPLWRTMHLPTALAPVREPDDVAAIKDGRSGFVVTSYTAVKHARGGYVASGSEPRMAGELALDHTNDSDVLPGGAETGIFLHDVLASVALADLAEGPSLEDWQALPATTWLLEKLGRRHARLASHLPLAARLVHQAYTATVRLGDSAMTGLAAAKTALREVEFLFPIPERTHPLLSQPQTGAWKVERGVVKGFVDLLFEHDGRVFVCDWKSDTLPRFDADTLSRHCGENYDVQARIYTLATLRLCGIASAEDYARRFGGVLFSFLRGLGEGSGIHFFTPTWEDVLAWETDMLGQQFWGIAR